jgi:competence protein ComEA
VNRLLFAGTVTLVAIVAIWHPAPAARAIASAAAATPRPFTGQVSKTATQLVVYVVGAVPRSGLYRLKEGSRVNDAVRLAGGFAAGADAAATNLAARVRDGDEIRVARLGEKLTKTPRSRIATAPSRSRRKRAAEPVAVDVNHADSAALATLPGIGPALADRIVAFRTLNGPFASPDDLADVAGMTTAKIDALTPYLLFN